jgi:hypothetical protein
MRRHPPPSAASSPDLPLDRHIVDILIEGVSRGDPALDSLEYMLSEQSDELPALWRAHRAALLKEAERRGIARPIWGEMHFVDTQDTPGGEGAG